MTPPDPLTPYLVGAVEAVSKLHKRLRRGVNQGAATATERDEAAAALATLRTLCRGRGIAPPDPDGRLARRRPRE